MSHGMTRAAANSTARPIAHSPSPCLISLIHASRLTSANRPPVDNPAATPTNATAPATHRPDAWMGYANGGGL